MRLYRECPSLSDPGNKSDRCMYGRCDPSCDAGFVEVEVVEIPWCAEHDAEMIHDPERFDCEEAMYCWHGFYLSGDPAVGTLDCRLEEPARHYRIDGNTVNP